MTKHPIIPRWVVYDNVEHEFSVYYDAEEARMRYNTRIKQINDEVGADEYDGDEEVYLCRVISKADLVPVGEDNDGYLYQVVAFDIPNVPKPIIRFAYGYREFRFFFAWFDMWIGIYFDPKNRSWYFGFLGFVLYYGKRTDDELRQQAKER